MRHETGSATGVGGVKLFTQAWLPAAAPQSVVVLVHGLGEHSTRYTHLAEALTDDGHAVYTLDHRGHGRSEGRRTDVKDFRDFVQDLDIVVKAARDGGPGLPLFVLGHSMGGLVALSYVSVHPDGIAGLIVSGTAASPPPSIAPLTISLGRMMAKVVPTAGVASLPLRKVSRDPAVVDAYFNDPLISKGKVRARMGAQLLDAMAAVDVAVASLRLPVLVLHGAADAIADASSSRRLHERLDSADKQLIIYDDLYHEIFNEPERDRVIGDVRLWLRVHRDEAGARR